MSVHVEVEGQGPPLTLLHGWGVNAAVWNGVREALARRFTLHLIDLPGHGRSAHVPVTDIDAFARDVAAAMPARGHAMGWSLGGHTAMAIAAREPARIDRLITICATPRFVAGPGWEHAKRPAVLADFSERLEKSYPATIRNFLALQALGQPEMRDVIRALQQAITSRGSPSVAGLAACLGILSSSDIRDEVRSLTVPALVIQGDHDALTPVTSAEWLAANLPGAQYRLIEHAAHAPFLSHRDEFLAAVMGFLSA